MKPPTLLQLQGALGRLTDGDGFFLCCSPLSPSLCCPYLSAAPRYAWLHGRIAANQSACDALLPRCTRTLARRRVWAYSHATSAMMWTPVGCWSLCRSARKSCCCLLPTGTRWVGDAAGAGKALINAIVCACMCPGQCIHWYVFVYGQNRQLAETV